MFFLMLRDVFEVSFWWQRHSARSRKKLPCRIADLSDLFGLLTSECLECLGGSPHIGWRTEFRSMEIQLTDFEAWWLWWCFLWVFYGFSMFFSTFSMGFLWLFYVFYGFSMGFLWLFYVFYGFSMGFLWFFPWFC